MKSKKILYEKNAHVLTIKNGYVDNHFSDKFIPLFHVDYFSTMINEN